LTEALDFVRWIGYAKHGQRQETSAAEHHAPRSQSCGEVKDSDAHQENPGPRRILGLVSSGDTAAVEEAYRATAKLLDRAGAKNIIHRNAASRQKSRLQRVIKKAKQPQPASAGRP
jgi:small subunit ribosomal protein S20